MPKKATSKKTKTAKNKTQPTNASVDDFLNLIENETKRTDCFKILEMMKEKTGDDPVMWGKSIVGFGNLHFISKSGREVDYMKIGFSPRKANISLYIMPKVSKYDDLLKKIGKHTKSVGCLYIKKLEDINLGVLKEIIDKCVDDIVVNKDFT